MKKYYGVKIAVWGADNITTIRFESEEERDEFYENNDHVTKCMVGEEAITLNEFLYYNR